MVQIDTLPISEHKSDYKLINYIMRLLSWAYTDNNGYVSRPKLLATTFIIDALTLMFTTAATLHIASTHLDILSPLTWFVAATIATSTVLILQANWTYSISALRKTNSQITKILISLLAISCIGAAGLHLTGVTALSRTWFPVWMALSVLTLVPLRVILSKAIETLARAGKLTRRVVIVGGGDNADEIIQHLDAQNDTHLEILGLFDDRNKDRAPEQSGPYKKLGTFDDLDKFCRDENVNLLIVTIPPSAEQRLLQILEKIWVLSVDVKLSALNSKLRLHKNAYSYLGSLPMLPIFDKPLNDWERVVKNIEDKVLGAIFLLLSLPVMAAVAIAIKLDSKGPVFFKQNRFGLNNELIKVYKFRSMYDDKSDANAAKLVTKDDDRVTKVGRFIRRTSLDELPQLINVLKGELSLVGPRPHATQAKAGDQLYQQVVQGYYARHKMKAGITGWAQVSGWRGETDTEEKIQKRVECDLHYIDNWSVLYDLYIIALTPIALVFGKNAY